MVSRSNFRIVKERSAPRSGVGISPTNRCAGAKIIRDDTLPRPGKSARGESDFRACLPMEGETPWQRNELPRSKPGPVGNGAGSTGNPPQALKLTAPHRGTIPHGKYQDPAAERWWIGAECLNASWLMSLGEAHDRSEKQRRACDEAPTERAGTCPRRHSWKKLTVSEKVA